MYPLRRVLLDQKFVRTMSQLAKPVEQSITSKLSSQFSPQHLQVINESYMHNVPRGAETHFRVVVVSDQFEGMNLVKRHRAVQHSLKEELESGVHALSIEAKTGKQWTESGNQVGSSPSCMGGFGK
ncbi:DNA-binding transcriptional regulator BolA-like [Sycon ciliatum]|uniref:DNA-binding transcriptional regulator BolA-like n=1 Tax=Sycon ciliatum TaxID=27933 RepID=UPI0020AC0841|eukprot:scpid100368/ scgid34914/ Putative bolA-like protein K11H12.1